jgi:hypothetical protein
LGEIAVIKNRRLDQRVWTAACAAATGGHLSAIRPAGTCRACGGTLRVTAELAPVADGFSGVALLSCVCRQLRADVQVRMARDGTPFGGVGSWYWRRRIPVAAGPEVRP